MKSLLKRGLNISVTLKNNKAQIILAIGIFIVCIGIAFSFIKGNSTITICRAIEATPEISNENFEEFYYNTNNVSTNDVIIINH